MNDQTYTDAETVVAALLADGYSVPDGPGTARLLADLDLASGRGARDKFVQYLRRNLGRFDLTPLDYFAAAALQGLLAFSPKGVGVDGQHTATGATQLAYEYAAAMMAERHRLAGERAEGQS